MNTEPANKCGLKREDFQTTVNGKKTDLFVLRNKQGNEVAVTNYGGAVVAIMMPDKDGNYANLIQGHDNIQDVINSPEPFLSVLIGRYGNRIKEGKFTARSITWHATMAPTTCMVDLQVSTPKFGMQPA